MFAAISAQHRVWNQTRGQASLNRARDADRPTAHPSPLRSCFACSGKVFGVEITIDRPLRAMRRRFASSLQDWDAPREQKLTPLFGVFPSDPSSLLRSLSRGIPRKSTHARRGGRGRRPRSSSPVVPGPPKPFHMHHKHIPSRSHAHPPTKHPSLPHSCFHRMLSSRLVDHPQS